MLSFNCRCTLSTFSTLVTARTGTAEVWAPEADPDGDDRCNALEAYLGSDPTDPDPSLFTSYVTSDHLIMRWTKKTGDRGVEATPQWSSTLQNFLENGAEIVHRTDLFTQIGYAIHEARVPRSAAVKARFLRLSLATP